MQSPVARLVPDGAGGEHGRVRYAKPSEWAAQKDIIKKLYLDENKTLDEVRRVMADEHQFYATPSMYKKRIRAWHFSKKLEDDDVIEVLQQKLERKAAGETSHNLVIRGRVVRNQRLRRFLERRPEVLARLQAQTNRYAPVGSSSAVYKVATEVPRVRSLSPESRNMEMTLSAVRNYIQVCASGPNASWVWTPGGYTSRKEGVTDLRGSRQDMIQAVDEFYCLQMSIDNNKPPKEIFQLLNSTLNHLSNAIKTELPDFVFQMLEIFQHPWSNHAELSRIFRRHVAELGVVHSGKNHPLSILWISLLKENDGGSTRLSESVLNMLLDEMVMFIGEDNDLTCIAFHYLMRFLIKTQSSAASYARLKKWMAKYPKWESPSRWSGTMHAKLEASEDPTVKQDPDMSGTLVPKSPISPMPPAAVEYKDTLPPDDRTSRYLLPYLAGCIAVRNGDAKRAESWFLKAKTVAADFKPPHILIFYPKTYTSLHILYVATKQDAKLKLLHNELVVLKQKLRIDTERLRRFLPDDCPDCF